MFSECVSWNGLVSWGMICASPVMPTERSADKPLPINCPRCGQRMRTHTSRNEPDATGKPELVYVYMCLQHGFFSFRNSKGLVAGL